ncbi:hypothetical protein CEUSTIGMA_g491.t1 [Chlamydomonas eustigma]|uniref:2-methoxy-6-polyprenyl-1,4-benzoquinol methylase, mitochondrial n=1 Tax=Chlamydomonas eustigma TaxID=1157962 RepID=A0A250WQR9_9CHLO|nr:hypothetical protein CEUSTIGMA_g491.t1 [Chlamydomonas eustigma]|eukprot:GAX73039.1 hypothetical protein CEUSTIGMA_g491.t1 [Chlamydomonas eustigma]
MLNVLKKSCSTIGNLRHCMIAVSHYSTNKSTPTDFGFKEVPWDEKQTLVGQVFSSVASSYDIMNDLMSGGLHRLWKDRLVETLRPFPGMKHLDVAGGTGDVAFRVLRALRQVELSAKSRPSMQSSTSSSTQLVPGSVVVCDINPSMLEEGKKKAEKEHDLKSDPGLSFEESNAENLQQFSDASFDSYTIAFGIRNVSDRAAALREAHRVLKPGGRFLCLEFSQVKQRGLKELYDMYSFNVIPRIGGIVANDSASYQYLVESIRTFPDQETFAQMMEEAGFKAVTFENHLSGIVAIHSGFKL